MSNKILKVVSIGMILLLCFSFTVCAAEDKIKTKEEIIKDKIKNKDFVKNQQPHDKTKFDRDVAGTLNLKVQSTKNKVPGGFEVPEDGYQTMVCYKVNDKILIRDTVHKIETVQVPWNEIATLPGFNGKSVLLKHYNDYGIQDAVWEQTVYNADGYAYLEELPFSEVIVSGFVGTYTKEDSDVSPDDSINLGYTFDSDDVNYINISIDDQYSSKTDPYDIDTTGLAGWWKFDEGLGTNVSDSSGNGYHGTYAGANYTPGKYSDAGDFGIEGDYVSTTYYTNLSEPLTLSFWINRKSPFDSNERIFGNFDTYSSSNVLISARYTDKVRFRYGASAIDSVPDTAEVILTNANQWYHIVWTNEPGESTATRNVYQDGVLIQSDIWPEAKTASEPFEISRLSLAANVTIDEVQIYNRILTLPEIKELYCISASSIQAKTNSHATYSTEWNSSTDNPLSVPYGAGESISSIVTNVTGPIVQDGVTIYDPVNMLFNTSVEIGHTENTTNIYEEVNGNSYQIFIQHIPGVNSTSGTVSFTSDANAILSSPYLTTGMDTSNTNAAMSYNPAARTWTVTTGAVTAGTTYNYVLYGVLEGEALEEIVEGGFGSDNMHVYTAEGNETIIVGSAFRATYGDSVWGNQSNELWEDVGPMLALAGIVIVFGIVLFSIRRFRE